MGHSSDHVHTVVQTSHAESVLGVSISPNGKYLASVSGGDSAAKVWNLHSGDLIRDLPGHYGWIQAIAFDSTGERILTGAWDRSAILWETNSGKILNRFTGQHVNDVAFLPDGRFLTAGMGGSSHHPLEKVCLYQQGIEAPVRQYAGHHDQVLAVTSNADGSLIATGANDGTIIVFDVDTGNIIWEHRLPHIAHDLLFAEKDGVEYLVVATASEGHNDVKNDPRTPHSIPVWDIRRKTDKEPIHTFPGHPDNVYSIDITTDRKYLASSSEDQSIRVWDWQDWSNPVPVVSMEGWSEEDQDGHRAGVACVGFDPNGQYMASGSYDSEVLLWEIEAGVMERKFEGHSASVFVSVMDPARKLMIEGSERNDINVWDLRKGEFSRSLTPNPDDYPAWISVMGMDIHPEGHTMVTGSQNGDLIFWNLEDFHSTQLPNSHEITSVRFSEKGDCFVAGVLHDGLGTVRCFDTATLNERVSFSRKSSWHCHADIHEGREIAVAAFDHQDQDSNNAERHPPVLIRHLGTGDEYPITDFVSRTRGIRLSRDGMQLAVACHDHFARVYDISDLTHIRLSHLCKHSHPWVLSVDFPEDGQTLVTGGRDDKARIWDLSATGREHDSHHVLEEATFVLEGHTSEVFARVSHDDEFVLSSSKDSTTKIWKRETGEELATLVSIGHHDWAVVTPVGLFDASPGAMKIMHYSAGMEVLHLDQLKERYYEPGLLSKLMSVGADQLRPVKSLEKAPLFPALTHIDVHGSRLKLGLSPRNGGLGKVSLFINKKEIREDINPQRAIDLTHDLRPYQSFFLPGENEISIRLYNEEGWLKSNPRNTSYFFRPTVKARSLAEAWLEETQPRGATAALYAIVVGTSRYRGGSLNLTYPDQDASSMAVALTAVGKKLFDDRLNIQLLTSQPEDGDPMSSKRNIREAFQTFSVRAKPEDILIVYFSGHGVNYGSAEKGQFYYLTKDVSSQNLSDPEIRSTAAISSEELTQWLTLIPAQKQFLIFDTCNSGKVIEGLTTGSRSIDSTRERVLDRMKDRTGMYVLAGSAADKLSFEASRYGQGLLTYTLLMGMKAAEEKNQTTEPTVDVLGLFRYSEKELPRLAREIGEEQIPVVSVPDGVGSFDIGIADEDAISQIPVATPKPIIIRSVFLDQEELRDHLGLEDVLDGRFIEISSRGKEAPIIFVNVARFPNAWKVSGLYQSIDSGYRVKARLYEGAEFREEFVVEAADSTELARFLEYKIFQMIRNHG